MTIQGLLDKVKKLDVPAHIEKIVKRSAKDLIELNQEQLFQFGIRSDGVKLKEYMNEYYAKEKFRRNPQPGFGTPDFVNKGSFFANFVVNVSKDSFEINSKDSKTSKLIERDGPKIFGLTKENKELYLAVTFGPDLRKYITDTTGLVFR